MRRFLFISLVAWFACEEPIAPGSEQDLARFQSTLDQGVDFGTPFSLTYGKQQELGEDGLAVGFQGKISDSRCPLDVECFWEGNARISLWLFEPGEDTIYVEPLIHGYATLADTGSHKRVFTEKYAITLLQLDPYPRAYVDTTIAQSDTAWISISLNDFPLLQDRLLPIEPPEYNRLSHNQIDGFGIDRAVVMDDSLLVSVNYGGGCGEHDFYFFGTTGLEYSIMPMVQAVLIHDAHADFCEAFIHRILKFDLLPVRQMVGDVSPVVIALPSSPDSVVYQF